MTTDDCERLRSERNALRDALAALTHEYQPRTEPDARGVFRTACCRQDSFHPVHATPDVVLGDLL